MKNIPEKIKTSDKADMTELLTAYLNKINEIIEYLTPQEETCYNCENFEAIDRGIKCGVCGKVFNPPETEKPRCAKCNNPFEKHHKIHTVQDVEGFYHTGCVPTPVTENGEEELNQKPIAN